LSKSEPGLNGLKDLYDPLIRFFLWNKSCSSFNPENLGPDNLTAYEPQKNPLLIAFATNSGSIITSALNLCNGFNL
jgi:hypothetical protein